MTEQVTKTFLDEPAINDPIIEPGGEPRPVSQR